MRNRLLWTLAIAILVTAALMLVPRQDPDAGPQDLGAPEGAAVESRLQAHPIAERTTDVPPSRRSANETRLVWPSPDSAPEVATDERRAGTIKGRLTWDGTFQPASGLEVRLTTRWLGSFERAPEDRPFFRGSADPQLQPGGADTDRSGSFEITGVPQDRSVFLVVLASGAMLDLRKIERLPEPGKVADLGEILLARRGGVTGILPSTGPALIRVLDDPIFENALLDPELHARMVFEASEFAPELFAGGARRQRDTALPFPEARPGADGRFTVLGVRPGPAWLVAIAKGGTLRKERITVEAGKIVDVGVLRSSAAEAQPGFVSTTRCIAESPEDRREAGLVFALSDATGRRVECATSANGLALAWGIAPSAVKRVQIRRQPGLAWEDATFTRSRVTQTPVQQPSAKQPTQAPTQPPTQPRGGRRGRGQRRDPAPPPVRESGELLVTLPETATLTIRTVDAEGAPVLAERVRLYRGDLGRPSAATLLPQELQPSSSQPGEYSAQGLPRAPVWLVANLRGQQSSVRLVDLAAQRVAAVEVRPEPLFDLRVLTRDPAGQPVAGAEVWSAAIEKSPQPVFVGKTGADGAIVVHEAFARGLFFAAQHPDWATSPAPAVTGPELEITMQLPVRITGLVTERGEPVPGTWMVLARPHPRMSALFDGNPFLEPRIAATNSDASFALKGLVPGHWIVTAAHSHAPRYEVDLAHCGHVHQVIELEPDSLHECSGRVLVDGLGYNELVVRLVASGGTLAHAAHHVARDGTFAFPGFPEGPCTLTLERRSRGKAPATLVRQELRSPPKNLSLVVRTGSASLDFSDPLNTLRECEISLEQVVAGSEVLGAQMTAITNERGLAFADSMPAGTYRVVAPGLPSSAKDTSELPQLVVIAGQTTNWSWAQK